MIVDLTHTLTNHITVYPGTLEPKFEIGNTIEKDGFAEINITMCTHTGTHMDAPCHIIPGTKSLDEFPIGKFIGPGLVVDCTQKASIELDRLKTFENQIRKIDFILFYTGWHSKWNTPSYFDPFPTLTTDAVNWLLNFDLKALGFDTISVDAVSEVKLPNHHLLLGREILIIENMTNLDKLIGKRFELNCIPLKIGKADGSPIRAFARIMD
jgi:kynurenine formamidase